MKNTCQKIIRFKNIDIILQFIAALVMIPLCFARDVGPFGLYLLAIVQCISCLSWCAYAKDNLPQRKEARNLRRLFIVVMIVHGICLLVPLTFLYLALFMLLAGPPLGIAYFVLTVRERRFYKDLAGAAAQPPDQSANN